jgi:hypothetical protein
MASIYDDRVMGKLKQIGYNALVFGTHFLTQLRQIQGVVVAWHKLDYSFMSLGLSLEASIECKQKCKQKCGCSTRCFFSFFSHFCDIADTTIIYKKI